MEISKCLEKYNFYDPYMIKQLNKYLREEYLESLRKEMHDRIEYMKNYGILFDLRMFPIDPHIWEYYSIKEKICFYETFHFPMIMYLGDDIKNYYRRKINW